MDNLNTICSICLEPNSNEELTCGHSFHSLCISRWRVINDSCPNCRGNTRLTDIRNFLSNLSDEEFSNYTCLNKQFSTISVTKGHNPPIRKDEINFIKTFSGKQTINPVTIDLVNRNIIAYIPKRSGNNIYIGKALIENDKIIFNNSYVISRTTGHTYKTSPLLRSYQLNENDLFYKVT